MKILLLSSPVVQLDFDRIARLPNLGLASLAATFLVIGWFFWRWETRPGRTRPAIPAEPAAYEPTEHL